MRERRTGRQPSVPRKGSARGYHEIWSTGIPDTVRNVSTQRNDADSGLAPVPRSTTTSDLVVEAIRSAILSGAFKPGETLVERRLAEQLGVSKTPVREALIALSATGLVQITPNRGTVVRAVHADDVRQAYEVRALLEPWAVARTVRRAGPDAVVEARTALTEAASHRSGEDHIRLSLANRRFHRALYAGCGNDIVVAQLDSLQELAALGAVALIWTRSPSWRTEHADHEEILAAVDEGAAERAERLTRKHIRQSVQRLA
jgi:DNA-binding GntR family transcriptional regulator